MLQAMCYLNKAVVALETQSLWNRKGTAVGYVQALYRFAQAGRRVIQRNRAARRLTLINSLVHSIKHSVDSVQNTPNNRSAVAMCTKQDSVDTKQDMSRDRPAVMNCITQESVDSMQDKHQLRGAVKPHLHLHDRMCPRQPRLPVHVCSLWHTEINKSFVCACVRVPILLAYSCTEETVSK